jgi:hypothetical protein
LHAGTQRGERGRLGVAPWPADSGRVVEGDGGAADQDAAGVGRRASPARAGSGGRSLCGSPVATGPPHWARPRHAGAADRNAAKWEPRTSSAHAAGSDARRAARRGNPGALGPPRRPRPRRPGAVGGGGRLPRSPAKSKNPPPSCRRPRRASKRCSITPARA